MAKVSTGIYGLDKITNGGFQQNKVVCVSGTSGTGKTLFGLQFILEGLRNGESAVYISLEQSQVDLIEEAVLMGWNDIVDYVKKKRLVFFETDGKEFREFMKTVLPRMVSDNKKNDRPTRIVVDSITPLIWEFKTKKEQREILIKLYTMLRSLGTVVALVEQHSGAGEPVDSDTSVPIFLSDMAISLQPLPSHSELNRSLRIVKMRGSPHGKDRCPMDIVSGFGICVYEMTSGEYDEKSNLLDQTIRYLENNYSRSKTDDILKYLNILKKSDPKQFNDNLMSLILEEYGLSMDY